jgi:hypothetical protein
MGLFDYPVRNFRCPACGAKMDTREYRAFKPWTCRQCGEQLQFSRRYGNVLGWTVMGCSFILAYAIGLRGWQFVIAGIVIWLLGMLLSPAIDKYFPPSLERYKPLESGFGRPKPLTLFPPDDSVTERDDPNSFKSKED